VNNRSLIFILAALSMLGALSIDAFLPALPAIAQAFSVSAAAAQQGLTVYLISFAVMSLFYGTLSDSFGRRPVILISMVLYVLSSLGAGLATSLSGLLLFRLLQGATAGAGGVVGRAMVGDLFQGAEAQRVMAYISVVFGLAPAIAPILGGWLLAAFGWRSIFVFIAVFSFLLLLICLKELPESLPRPKRHPFHFQAIVSNYVHVGSRIPFMLQAFSGALAFTGIMLYVGSAPAFIIGLLHLKVTDFGWLFIPMIGGMTLGSWISGRWSHRYSQAFIIRTGFGIMIAASLANLAYAWIFPPAVPWAILGPFAYAFGMALATPAMAVRTLEVFPLHRGLASSLQGFMFMVVFAFCSGVICPLLFGSNFLLASGLVAGLILSAVCWWLGTLPQPIEPDLPLPGDDELAETQRPATQG
jgi:MFS transporter, DHA1 family, multidrug resistance protein